MSKPPLREDQLESALQAFVIATANQFRLLGFETPNPVGAYRIQLRDDPITTKDDQGKWNGRLWFRTQPSTSLWHHSDDPGVYIFFKEDREACYVGKAEDAIGARIWSHLGTARSVDGFPNAAFPDAQYIITIPFTEAPFLAPAFESFLLSTYAFCYNKTGATRSLRGA